MVAPAPEMELDAEGKAKDPLEAEAEREVEAVAEDKPSPPPKEEDDVRLLMADTANITQAEFQVTDEMKALTQEVIKTIRDIIVSCAPHFHD